MPVNTALARVSYYLLANQHRIPNGSLVDALNLAAMDHGANQRITIQELVRQLRCSTENGACMKIARLKRLDLIKYKCGGTTKNHGYLFSRIGPVCLPQATAPASVNDDAAAMIEQLCSELLELCELARPHVDPDEIAEAERTVDTAHRMIYDD